MAGELSPEEIRVGSPFAVYCTMDQLLWVVERVLLNQSLEDLNERGDLSGARSPLWSKGKYHQSEYQGPKTIEETISCREKSQWDGN